ncbi:MAG: GTP-binding protein [Promethearchaeota archaeon]
MAEEYDYLFKSIVVGDGGVGKTALTLRFSKGFFTEDYKMTIGVDFHVKTINIDSVEGPLRAKLQIWDTGGQERFSSIRPMYYRGSLGALLIFDLTNSASFEHLPQWIEEVRANVKTEIPLLLVGNKSDLVDQRMVSLEEINNFTAEFNLYYMETSAKTGEGVGDCFYILACLMIGSGVPDMLISKGIVFSPGQVPITATGVYPTPMQRLEPELDYAAPPVPEPISNQAHESSSTFEPEPEYEFEAPPVPEPILEPEFEPEIPLPDSKIAETPSQPVEFEFRTPEEILSNDQQITPSQPSFFTSREEAYKPKAIPFSNNVPVPAPAPEEFQSLQTTASVESAPSSAAPSSAAPLFTLQDTTETKSDSLMDYLPEPMYSKKERKKLEKQKKKEEKEKKIQEEKEKQEKLLEQMKKTKKEKKEKPKKEKPKKEKKEKIDTKSIPTTPTLEVASTPSLFQTLSQKTDETEKTSVSAFMPFTVTQEPETQEASKLRIIPNVTDIESKVQPSEPIQAPTKKPSGKETIICKQCGALLSSDYQFCNKCGSQL